MPWIIEITDYQFKCPVCHTTRPSGSMCVIYIQETLDENKVVMQNRIRYQCVWHKICKVFEVTGQFCQNHQDCIDGECNSVPF